MTTNPQPNPHGRILLLHGERKQLRELAPILRSAVKNVDVRDRLQNVDRLLDYDLVLAEFDFLEAADRAALHEHIKARPHCALLLLAGSAARDEYPRLFQSQVLTNLVARNNQSVDAEELLVTVQKLLRRDIFGIEKYFGWGVDPEIIRVTRSTQKLEVIDQAQEFATRIGVHPRLASLFRLVADELVTNAVYNAPVDAQGQSLFGHLDRRQEVVLPEGQAVEVKFTCDGRRLGISTSDPYGSLTRERLLNYLSKCLRRGDDQVDDKPGGAGLGLYYVFESLSHFVVNISQGRKTEMIGLLDIRGSYREFASRSKSFNVFVG